MYIWNCSEKFCTYQLESNILTKLLFGALLYLQYKHGYIRSIYTGYLCCLVLRAYTHQSVSNYLSKTWKCYSNTFIIYTTGTWCIRFQFCETWKVNMFSYFFPFGWHGLGYIFIHYTTRKRIGRAKKKPIEHKTRERLCIFSFIFHKFRWIKFLL